MPPVFRTVGLSAGTGSFVISDVDIELEAGSILGLLGRSGSGKSTLVETFVGLRRPLAGSIEIDGAPMRSARGRVGFVPQQTALWDHLTVVETLETFGRIYRVPRDELKRRIDVLLDRLNLSEHRRKRIEQLSGGMRRRVDFAAGLIHMPHIIFLDEPFTGLDIGLRRFLWAFLQELAKQGSVIVIASHLVRDLQEQCSLFAIVENGKVYDDARINERVREIPGGLEALMNSLFLGDER